MSEWGSHGSRARMGLIAAAVSSVFAGSALAQDNGLRIGTDPDAGVTVYELPEIRDPSSEEAIAFRALQKRRLGYEREIKKIRGTYFRRASDADLRSLGLRKMREFTDPASFGLLVEFLAPMGDDIRDAVFDHLARQGTAEADAALAWESVYHDGLSMRETARDALAGRVRTEDAVPSLVHDVLRMALRESDESIVLAATDTASTLGVIDLIPMIAAAQVVQNQTIDEPEGDLGYILIGTQTPFVSDVQPVVANGTVAFDPQLSVVTEGVLLRVIDASVVIYRTEVHAALVDWTTRVAGESTAPMGYDIEAWHRWYAEDLVPLLAVREADSAGG